MGALRDCERDGCQYEGSMFCIWCGLTAEDREDDVQPPACLEAGGDCEGKVAYREPLSGTGQSFPRCEAHWEIRLDRQKTLDERYPQTDTPPWDFDPTYAGETW